jgi:hypothetical protein
VLATLPEATLAASYRRWGQSRPHAKLPYVTRRPPNLPLFPERVYRGWVGPWLSWRDWLGLPPAEVVAPQQAGATRAATAPHARGGRAAAPAGECRAAARAARCPPPPPPGRAAPRRRLSAAHWPTRAVARAQGQPSARAGAAASPRCRFARRGGSRARCRCRRSARGWSAAAAGACPRACPPTRRAPTPASGGRGLTGSAARGSGAEIGAQHAPQCIRARRGWAPRASQASRAATGWSMKSVADGWVPARPVHPSTVHPSLAGAASAGAHRASTGPAGRAGGRVRR